MEFSSLFYAYLTLQNGVSQATRYGVTGNTNGRHVARGFHEERIRQATPTLVVPDGAFTFQHMPAGGGAWLGGTGAPGEIEKITVDLHLEFLHPDDAAVLPDRRAGHHRRLGDAERKQVPMTRRSSGRLSNAKGQSMVEIAMIMPLFLVIVLGVCEVGYGLLDQHAVTRMSREGSNMISRDTSLQDAVTVLRGMSSRPVNFNNGSSKVILSVLKSGETTGTSNYDRIILYQRYEYGTYPGTSKLLTAGGGSFPLAPDYQAVNSDNNTGLRVTSVAPNLVAVRGGMIYVTEIYSRHVLITPLDRFGVTVPQTLYSIAYF